MAMRKRPFAKRRTARASEAGLRSEPFIVGSSYKFTVTEGTIGNFYECVLDGVIIDKGNYVRLGNTIIITNRTILEEGQVLKVIF